MEALESKVKPSWPGLVEPLERIVDRLQVVWGAVNHLKSVKDSPELRAAIEEVQVGALYALSHIPLLSDAWGRNFSFSVRNREYSSGVHQKLL